VLCLRPEAVRLRPGGGDGRVLHRRFLGASALYTVAWGPEVTVEAAGPPDLAAPGDPVGIDLAGPGLHLFPVAE
jgi:hypothetical protein